MPTKQRNQVRKGSHGGMQLVLTEDVSNLGRQGELVEVKPGYGRNYLIPNGLATVPTEHNLRLLGRYKERVKQAREARIADLKVMAEQIQRVTVTLEANAHETVDEDGTKHLMLYGSIGSAEISRSLKALNLSVEPDMIRLEGPIRQCALFSVKVNLGYDIETDVKVLVVKQQDKK